VLGDAGYEGYGGEIVGDWVRDSKYGDSFPEEEAFDGERKK
jgi:hypothetical protein